MSLFDDPEAHYGESTDEAALNTAASSAAPADAEDSAGASEEDARLAEAYAFYAERARRRRRLTESVTSPRELVLAWCLWLLGSWVVIWARELADGNVWGLAAPNAVRWMVLAGLLGMMLLWPLYRLSQGSAAAPLTTDDADDADEGASSAESSQRMSRAELVASRDRQPAQASDGESAGAALAPAGEGAERAGGAGGAQEAMPSTAAPSSRAKPWRLPRLTPSLVLRDWFCLMMVFQTVLWTLRITAHWSIAQTLWLNGAIAAWSLLAAAIIAWSCRANTGLSRTWGMLFCLLLLLGEPLAMLIVNAGGSATFGDPTTAAPIAWTMRVSPLETVWRLTEVSATDSALGGGLGDGSLQPWSRIIAITGIAAAAAWIIIAVFGQARREPTPSTPDRPATQPQTV